MKPYNTMFLVLDSQAKITEHIVCCTQTSYVQFLLLFLFCELIDAVTDYCVLWGARDKRPKCNFKVTI